MAYWHGNSWRIRSNILTRRATKRGRCGSERKEASPEHVRQGRYGVRCMPVSNDEVRKILTCGVRPMTAVGHPETGAFFLYGKAPGWSEDLPGAFLQRRTVTAAGRSSSRRWCAGTRPGRPRRRRTPGCTDPGRSGTDARRRSRVRRRTGCGSGGRRRRHGS